jgi:hypothetical protein
MSPRAVALILAALAGALGGAALGQEPAASCSCDPARGALVIRYTPDLGTAAPPWPEAPSPTRFFELLDLDQTESTVEDTRTAVLTCHLAHDRFEITLGPGVPNVSLVGRCGAAVTGWVTVLRNGVAVLKEQWFEELNCHERERLLESITFRDGSPKPVLRYTAYEEPDP